MARQSTSLGILGNPQTPLLHDILTIQAKYGADPTTRTGDTIYFSNSNAGNAVYDLAQNPFPYLSVYDAGGEDTFDFSTANTRRVHRPAARRFQLRDGG